MLRFCAPCGDSQVAGGGGGGEHNVLPMSVRLSLTYF